MLALKVEYLTGVCMATKHDDPSRSTPEWPPHPDRLYSALVAAAASLAGGEANALPEQTVGALKWLAESNWDGGRLVAPQLHVPEAQRRVAPEVHLPANPHEDEVWQKPKTGRQRAPQQSFDLRTLLPVHRNKTALPFPAVVPDDPVAYFIWPDAAPDEHLDVLRDVCDRVTYLGRSRSLVRVSIVDDPPPPTHVPDPVGQLELRVPGPHRLKYLVDNYARRGGKPDPCPPYLYRRKSEDPDQVTVSSIFERIYIFKPEAGDPTLPASSTQKLTQALRRALIACIEEEQRRRGLEPNVPDIVHGHGRHPHCAFAALPFVHPHQRHADGSIKGVVVLVPHEVEEEALQSLAAGLMRLQENGLRIPGLGTWRLAEVPADDPQLQTLRAPTWCRPSRLWTTATPMVFGRFPKPKTGGSVRIVLDSLRMIGVDPKLVVEVAVGRHSPLHGASPSWHFKTQQHDGEREEAPRVIRHVTLRFDCSVAGPLILGAKRYFGLGLMWPLEES